MLGVRAAFAAAVDAIEPLEHMPVEFVIEDHGTVVLVRPRTDTAKAWAEGTLSSPAGRATTARRSWVPIACGGLLERVEASGFSHQTFRMIHG
jgi:hypothetical protein